MEKKPAEKDKPAQLGAAAKLKERFYGLSPEMISAAVCVYEEVVKYHEKSVRLTAEQFRAVRADEESFRKAVIYLVANDWNTDKSIPIVCKMWLMPELGRGRGWVRLALKLPSRPPSQKQ